jgi:lysozyme
MTTSQEGRSLIESFEGFKTSAYLDGRGIWTCGYGHTGGVLPNTLCDQAMADAWMESDLATAEHAVNTLVHFPINQNQFDALVSLCFNIGSGNFAESTVVRKLNMGDMQGAAAAILMWNKIGGEVSVGLSDRRAAEQTLFLTPMPG